MKRLLAIFLLISTSATAGSAVDEMLDAAADRHGIPRNIVHAVAMVESTKRCGARNGASVGIMQVQRGATKHVGMQWPPRSCEEEIEIGVRYLKIALEKGGYGCKGITLYNTGVYATPRCSAYGRKVLKEMK